MKPDTLPDVTIRSARKTDRDAFIDLILMASPEYRDIFGTRTDDILKRFFRDKNNMYSHNNVLVALVNGEAAGLILGYGHYKKLYSIFSSAAIVLARADDHFFSRIPMLVEHSRVLGDFEPGEYFLSNLAVYPEHRRLGLGALLLEAFEKRASKDNATAVVLETSVENQRAIAFYRKNGYRANGGFCVTMDGKRKSYLKLRKEL